MGLNSRGQHLPYAPIGFRARIVVGEKVSFRVTEASNQKRHMTPLIHRGLERCSCGDSLMSWSETTYRRPTRRISGGRLTSDEVLGVAFC